MYKVGIHNGIIYIYNSVIPNVKDAVDSSSFIGAAQYLDHLLAYRSVAWKTDPFVESGVNMGHSSKICDTIELAFLTMKLALVEYGFDGIMDLEFPIEVCDV